MAKKLIILAFMALVLLSGNAEAVLINYDGTGFNYPTQILGYYSGLDGSPVHSSGFMWLDYNGSISDIYGPHSVNAMAFAIDTNPVWISWSADVDSVSLWYGHQVNNPLSIQGYNNDVLAFDSGSLAQNSGGMFQYTPPNVSIDKLVFNGTPNYWTFDDLSYGLTTTEVPPDNNVIPEPATMLLVGSGLVGLLRKKVNTAKKATEAC